MLLRYRWVRIFCNVLLLRYPLGLPEIQHVFTRVSDKTRRDRVTSRSCVILFRGHSSRGYLQIYPRGEG